MSFLNQLKSQTSALQAEHSTQQTHHEVSTRLTEAASHTAWLYIAELAKQLDVIEPSGPKLSLDGKTEWPAMKLIDFRVDTRKKKLRDKDVYDYIVIGWRIVPVVGAPVAGSVSANSPLDLNRIEARGSVMITPDHEPAKLAFRLANGQGFGLSPTSYAADQVQSRLPDEMAKLIVGQASCFI